MNEMLGSAATETETTAETATVVDESEDNEGNETETETDGKTKKIKKGYFPPSSLQSVEFRAQMLALGKSGMQVVYNFDQAKEFPAGFGIGVVPIAQQTGGENKTIGYAVAAIPTPETIAGLPDDKGNQFIRGLLINACMAKVASAVRPKQDEEGISDESIPRETIDFVEKRSRGQGLNSFNELADKYVKALRKNGFKTLDKRTLRMSLQSSAAAQSLYPKIPQEQWLFVLGKMKAAAVKAEKDAQIFVSWEENRDNKSFDEPDEIDFDALDEMLGE